MLIMSKRLTQLDLADAALQGYGEGRRGYSMVSLVETNGITKEEWHKLKTQYATIELLANDSFFTEEIQAVEDYFNSDEYKNQ